MFLLHIIFYENVFSFLGRYIDPVSGSSYHGLCIYSTKSKLVAKIKPSSILCSTAISTSQQSIMVRGVDYQILYISPGQVWANITHIFMTHFGGILSHRYIVAHFTSNVRAIAPATVGVAALVPINVS